MPKRRHVIAFALAGLLALGGSVPFFAARGLHTSPVSLVVLGLAFFYLAYILNEHVQ